MLLMMSHTTQAIGLKGQFCGSLTSFLVASKADLPSIQQPTILASPGDHGRIGDNESSPEHV